MRKIVTTILLLFCVEGFCQNTSQSTAFIEEILKTEYIKDTSNYYFRKKDTSSDNPFKATFVYNRRLTITPDVLIPYFDKESKFLHHYDSTWAKKQYAIFKITKQNFTKKEKKYIIKQLKIQTRKREIWPDNLFQDSKGFYTDTLSYNFRYNGHNHELFYRKDTLGLNYKSILYYEFCDPIFLRNNTICLFYFIYFGYSTTGDFSIYKLTNGKWSKWYSIQRSSSFIQW